MRTLLSIAILTGLFATGCGNGSENLTKAEETDMRSRMDKGLSKAEIEKYFGKEAANKVSGAPAPVAKPKG